MNNLNLKFSSILSRLCALVIGLLGFGCSSEEDAPLMYGSPTGHFEIKGEVTDEEGAPIPDVEVSAIPSSKNYPIVDMDYIYLLARDTTDNKGTYTLANRDRYYTDIKVIAKPLNGNFEPDSAYVELKYVKEDGMKDNFWYHGSATVDLNFKLKRKSEE